MVKQQFFTKGTSDDSAHALLQSVGKYLPVPQDVLDNMEIFTIRYIYNVSKSLSNARARKWRQMKKRSTLRLPPDKDSHNLKVTRGKYQTYMLLHYGQVEPAPSPLGHGWTLENGKCIPVRHTKPALPKRLKDAMQNQNSTSGYSDSECSDTDDEDNIEDDM